ncbi:relaxase/mobilization nuclease domain-containing protein (plasmid) [Acidithiobacillus caldus SM-1]|uniref:Relaxase/mobilization nuclease domain-containing protein n=1 Tax=Acidithiobacillus caldus (strain SM-1) TaxID=990288 RepID=F9ZUU8_ACICS|nr:LPD7 domain-containing protein [Acidithiobacillus caldus]AEK59801.1 relaxase/mobilization nuclease domain-containing protein [Acidithiobacillus caldus SM-1]
MAIYHLHAKTWSKGAGQGAGGHARYVLRQGPYARRMVERVEGSAVQRVAVDRAAEVVASYSGHLPAWTDGDPVAYWDAADAHERANGTVYRELEFALPGELSERRNLELAQAFAEALARVDRGATPYTLVLHRGARDPELLHCHLMLSDRVNDGCERSPELWFRRAANRGKDPARGGAPKTQSRIAQDWLGTVVRPLWAELANAALEQARCVARIDHRSLEAQRRERELLAEQAREQGDELAAARYWKAAAVLDRPAQPKRGRVLEHGGPECAPGQARVWERYEKALVERQAAIDAVLSAEREAERLRAEIARERQREERRAAAKREREASHGGWPDGMAVARGVLAYLEALGRAYRQEVRTRWERRQAERRRAALDAQRVERERQERQGRLLDLAASLAADAECRLRLREAYEAAGFRLEQRPDGKWVFVYPYRDLPEERQAVREARRAWDDRRRVVERDRITEQERRPGIRHPDKPRWRVERERILTEVYGEAVAEQMGRWYRIERQGETLVFRNSVAEVTDHGDRVTAAAGNEREIEAMIALARAKGWTRVSLTGSPEFRERAACVFLEAGFTLDDPALEERARQALEVERAALVEQQERETRPGIRHADRSQWAVDREWVVSRKYDYRHAERAERNGFYSRWMDDEQGLFYERKKDGVRFIDQGALIVAPRDEPYREGAPEVYVLYAQARGWQSIDILGDEAFRLRAARVALEEGLEVSDPDLTRRAQGLIKAELRRVPQPEVQTVPQPAQRPAPEPKAPTSPLFTGEWKGSTQGSPRAGGPALFTVKHGEASVYHDHQRAAVVLEPAQTSKGPALRGTVCYPDGHSITLVIDLSDRQGRGYGVWVAVKDRDGQIIEKQAGKIEPQQRDLNRGHGKGIG